MLLLTSTACVVQAKVLQELDLDGGGGGTVPIHHPHTGGGTNSGGVFSLAYHRARASSPVFLPANPYRQHLTALAHSHGHAHVHAHAHVHSHPPLSQADAAALVPRNASALPSGAALPAVERCERCGAAHMCVPDAHAASVGPLDASAAAPAASTQPNSVNPLSLGSVLRARYGGSNGARAGGRSGSVAWRRILYERQPFPDNYTDATFLSGLVTNANVHEQKYGAIARDTASITQRVSVITLFFVAFHAVSHATIPAAVLIVVDVLLMIAGAAVVLALTKTTRSFAETAEIAESSIKRLMLFVCALLGVSPVLKTLTMSYSSDTIWALCIVLIAVHLFVHDYAYINSGVANRLQSTLSLNAGIFASVLLASRLSATLHVFAFIFFAYLIFAGFPVVAHHIKRASTALHLVATAALCVVTVCLLLAFTNRMLAGLYTAFVVFVTFASPRGLLFVQRYKNEIQGPWDYDDSPETASGE